MMQRVYIIKCLRKNRLIKWVIFHGESVYLYINNIENRNTCRSVYDNGDRRRELIDCENWRGESEEDLKKNKAAPFTRRENRRHFAIIFL